MGAAGGRDKTFNLGYNRYGGGWEFSFRKKVIENF
jgi:hypothetical protein